MNGSAVRPGSRSGLTLALLAFTQFITAIDFDIVFVTLPAIGRGLGFSLQSLQGVVSAYTVVFGGFLLFGGRAADRLGARRMFVLGLVLFGISSLVAGLATTPTMLVVARAVQGMGAALLTPSTLKLIATTFAEGSARNRAMSIWGASGASGAAVGALGGGVLTSAFGWESVFFVNVPLVLVALLATPGLLSPDVPNARAVSFDLPGALLATFGATLLVFGLVNGPEYGWFTVRGVGALVPGVLLLGLFLLVESRVRDPLVPLRLFRNRNVVAAIVTIFLFMGTVGTQYYLFTTYLQDVLAYTPLQAGFAFLPLSIFSMVGAAKVVPILLNRWGNRITLIIGMTGVSASMVALPLGMSVTGTYWAVLPGVLLWGLFAGIAFPPMFVAVSTGVDAAEQGVASALASTSQYIGAAVGLAALVAVANIGLPKRPDVGPMTDTVGAGLQRAGLTSAGVTIAGALLVAFILRKSSIVVPTDEVPITGRMPTGRE